jgi:hypothetical protein
MKHKIIFDLDSPDDLELLRIHNAATDMHCILWEMREEFRQWRKYREARSSSMTASDMLEQLETHFHALCSERNLPLE